MEWEMRRWLSGEGAKKEGRGRLTSQGEVKENEK